MKRDKQLDRYFENMELKAEAERLKEKARKAAAQRKATQLLANIIFKGAKS